LKRAALVMALLFCAPARADEPAPVYVLVPESELQALHDELLKVRDDAEQEHEINVRLHQILQRSIGVGQKCT
jgi:hypothetical protein